MENCRKSVLFLFLSAFFIAFSVSARAETVEEKKAAVNYDETLPAPEEAPAVEEAPLVPQVPAGAQPVQAVVPPAFSFPETARSPTVPRLPPGKLRRA